MYSYQHSSTAWQTQTCSCVLSALASLTFCHNMGHKFGRQNFRFVKSQTVMLFCENCTCYITGIKSHSSANPRRLTYPNVSSGRCACRTNFEVRMLEMNGWIHHIFPIKPTIRWTCCYNWSKPVIYRFNMAQNLLKCPWETIENHQIYVTSKSSVFFKWMLHYTQFFGSNIQQWELVHILLTGQLWNKLMFFELSDTAGTHPPSLTVYLLSYSTRAYTVPHRASSIT